MSPHRGWPFLADPRHAELTAASAVLMHGLIAIIVVAPILARNRRRALNSALAFVGGVAVDLDHVVAAGSVSPRAMEHLGYRPDTHSLVLALGVAVLVLMVARSAVAAWCTFAVIASHVIFDAAGGGDRWLYPLSQSGSVPWLLCPASILVMLALSGLIARYRYPRRDAGLTARRGPSPPASERGNAWRSSASQAILRPPRGPGPRRTGARTATRRPLEDRRE
jgi:hypothetical protein